MGMTLVQAWKMAKTRLEAAALSGPVIDARLLVEAAAGATRVDIVTDPHRRLTEAQEATLREYLARREQREPVSHILGRKGFWKIMLSVTPDVLTPRPDTETLVEYVLRDFPEQARWQVLDLGVGSGTPMGSGEETDYLLRALEQGFRIRFEPDLVVFHAGTRRDGDRLVANGGRVLDVTALGPTIAEARDRAYAAIAKIDWPEGFYRRDIGWREVAREES